MEGMAQDAVPGIDKSQPASDNSDMITLRHAGHLWNVALHDGGTLDTEILIRRVTVARERGPAWKLHSFDHDYAASFRRRDGMMTLRGMRELGREAIAAQLEAEALDKVQPAS